MDHKNAKVGHVQYVNELLKAANEVLTLTRFQTTSPFQLRSQMMHAVKYDSYKKYYDVDFDGPWTVGGMRDWLDVIETLNKELGTEARLETDYDSTVSAHWEWEVPYTAEEKQKAKDWLEANPAPEPQTIQWRSLAPNMIRWVEDDVEPF